MNNTFNHLISLTWYADIYSVPFRNLPSISKRGQWETCYFYCTMAAVFTVGGCIQRVLLPWRYWEYLKFTISLLGNDYHFFFDAGTVCMKNWCYLRKIVVKCKLQTAIHNVYVVIQSSSRNSFGETSVDDGKRSGLRVLDVMSEKT